jgi:hypothetical protein
MQRNSDKCGHCGRMFVRTDRTAIVNRSDGKTFHVSLISGPDPRPFASGGFHKNQAVCKFGYVHDRIGPQRYFLDVFIGYADDGQAESAADKVADLVHEGRELGPTYALNNDGLLKAGFPQ